MRIEFGTFILSSTQPPHIPHRKQVNFKSHCMKMGIQNCTFVPRKCVIILKTTTINIAAYVLALLLLQHTNMDRTTQLGSYILKRQPKASLELLLTGTADANCVYILMRRVILEHYKMSIHR
jgi:hypothetical protein